MPEEAGKKNAEKLHSDLWLIYDGECPLCNKAAHAIQIKKTVGNLHLINAREDRDHPLVKEASIRQLDLDEGMVLKYQGSFYHGQDTLHMMAFLGSEKGWFNRLNAFLIRSKFFARLSYPAMRAMRNTLLRFKGVQKIRNLSIDPNEPLFKNVFGEQWDALPQVIKNRYAVRPFSDDIVKVEGTLDVTVSPLVSIMARLSGMLIPYSGKNVPVTVIFKSDKTGAIHYDRIFHFPDKGDFAFPSRMEWLKENQMVEFLRFGIGLKLAFEWDGAKVALQYKGYVLRIFGINIPMPFAFVIGKGYAEETPLSDDRFNMWVYTKHRLFGNSFGYTGEFKIIEVSCGQS